MNILKPFAYYESLILTVQSEIYLRQSYLQNWPSFNASKIYRYWVWTEISLLLVKPSELLPSSQTSQQRNLSFQHGFSLQFCDVTVLWPQKRSLGTNRHHPILPHTFCGTYERPHFTTCKRETPSVDSGGWYTLTHLTPFVPSLCTKLPLLVLRMPAPASNLFQSSHF